ncbi:MAG: glycine cleavage system aminomethyltransferase GcvT [Gammaproteobacteria bacterium]
MSRDASARETALSALHRELGARLVPFAGYLMPLQYAGIREEHLHTRAQAALFDVSHMGQIVIEGALDALETLVPGDIVGLATWRQRYTLLTNSEGGIRDDLMVTRLPDRLFVVANAACKEADHAHLVAGLGDACAVHLADDRALLALQGPAAAAVLAELDDELATLPFMAARACRLAGHDCLVNRCGYTGEDGFEIALDASGAEALARQLLADARVAPAGLGARASLRLEAGLCLSGTDIDATTSPVAADLAWTLARKYRDGSAMPRFPGAAAIMAELAAGAPRVRVGLRPDGRIPLRGGTELADTAGRSVGIVTSGSFGASAGHPVAMGYVERALAAPGTRLEVTIRERRHAVEVCALPFVPHRYYRGRGTPDP